MCGKNAQAGGAASSARSRSTIEMAPRVRSHSSPMRPWSTRPAVSGARPSSSPAAAARVAGLDVVAVGGEALQPVPQFLEGDAGEPAARPATTASQMSSWDRPLGLAYPATGWSRHPGDAARRLGEPRVGPVDVPVDRPPSCSASASTSSGRMRQTVVACAHGPTLVISTPTLTGRAQARGDGRISVLLAASRAAGGRRPAHRRRPPRRVMTTHRADHLDLSAADLDDDQRRRSPPGGRARSGGALRRAGRLSRALGRSVPGTLSTSTPTRPAGW